MHLRRRCDETACAGSAWPSRECVLYQLLCILSHLCPPPRPRVERAPISRQATTHRDETDRSLCSRGGRAVRGPRDRRQCVPLLARVCTADPQTDVAPGKTRSRNVRSRCRCSMWSAIHINSRNWLRSSSTHEPSDPPHRVVNCFSAFPRGHTTRRSATRHRASWFENSSVLVVARELRRGRPVQLYPGSLKPDAGGRPVSSVRVGSCRLPKPNGAVVVTAARVGRDPFSGAALTGERPHADLRCTGGTVATPTGRRRRS